MSSSSVEKKQKSVKPSAQPSQFEALKNLVKAGEGEVSSEEWDKRTNKWLDKKLTFGRYAEQNISPRDLLTGPQMDVSYFTYLVKSMNDHDAAFGKQLKKRLIPKVG